MGKLKDDKLEAIAQDILRSDFSWEEIEQRYKPTTLGELLLRVDYDGTMEILVKAITDSVNYECVDTAVMVAHSLHREMIYRRLKEEYSKREQVQHCE